MNNAMPNRLNVGYAIDLFNARFGRCSPARDEVNRSIDVPKRGSYPLRVTAFDLEANNRFASDAFDCSFRQTPVSILRNEIEVSRDQSKLYASTAAVKNKDIHCLNPAVLARA